MEKPTISAKDALKDIRSGMDDDALKKKYGLNATGLQSLFAKLTKAGLITQVELDERRHPVEAVAGKPETDVPAAEEKEPEPAPEQTAPPREKNQTSVWKCPACGAAQPEEQYVCPQCGVIVAKYLKKQAELGRAPQPTPKTPPLSPPLSPPLRGQAASEQADKEEAQSETKRCPFCSEEIHRDATKCKHCGEWLEIPPEELRSDDSDRYCPWEDASNLGWFVAFWDTATGCLFSPKAFFSRLPISSGYGPPLIYGLIAATIGIGLGQLWNMLFGLGPKELRALAIVMIFLSPLVALIGIGIGAAVNHVCLMILGGAHEDFEASFRVMCYSSSAALWEAVPVMGSLIHGVWAMVAIVIGLREVHGTTTGKAIAAVLLPVVVCCGLGAILLFIVVGALIGAGSKGV